MAVIVLTFQRRRFAICIYALFLILSGTISICIFGTKAKDKVLCPLQYENLECYSDKQGNVVTLQRGNGQTIIGSSKDDDPITYAQEYDFSRKCENSIYLFKNHEDDSEDEPLKKVDVAVYSIAKHKIYCEKTLDISISDPKRCAVLQGENVCVVSSNCNKDMFVCKCTPKGKMKVHDFKSDIESISASPDGKKLYAKLSDENKIVVHKVILNRGGSISFNEVDTIDTEDNIVPRFLHENVFADADGGTYIKNEGEFVSFVKVDAFEDHICFGDPYLIYASASDKINFVDVTSREEYASMQVDGEIVHLAVCSYRNKNTLFTYVVKRDGQLFHNKMKIDDAISKISLAASEVKEATLMDKQEMIHEKAAREVDDEVMDQEPKVTERDTSVKDNTQAEWVSADKKAKNETIRLVEDDEVKQLLGEVQTQMERKEIEQNLEEITENQMQRQVPDVDEKSECPAVVEQPEPVQVTDGKELHENLAEEKIPEGSLLDKVSEVLEAVQEQVEHNEIEEKLDVVAEKAAKDSEIFVSQPTKEKLMDEVSTDDVEIKDEQEDIVDQAEEKQASEGDEEITEEKVCDALNEVQAKMGKKEIEQNLEEFASQQIPEQASNVDKLSESSVVAEQPEPVQVSDGKERYEHPAEEKVLEEPLLNEVRTIVEDIQAKMECNEIEENLGAVAGKSQCDDEKSAQISQIPPSNKADVLPLAQMNMVEQRWKSLKITQGLFDITRDIVPKDKKKNIESRIISRKAFGKVASTVSQDKQIPNVDISELHQVAAVDLLDEDTLSNSTEAQQRKRVKLHIPKQEKAELKESQSEKSVDHKKAEGVKRNIRELRGPKRKRARLMSCKDEMRVCKVPSKIVCTENQDNLTRNIDLSELYQVETVDLLNKATASISTEVQQRKRVKLHIPKQEKAELKESRSEKSVDHKKAEGVKRNIRAPQGLKRKRARLMPREDNIHLAGANIVQDVGLSVSEQVKSVQDKIVPSDVWRLSDNERNKKQDRVNVSKGKLPKNDIAKVKQNPLHKGRLRKSASERSILSGDLFPHVPKSEVQTLRGNSPTSSRKKRTRLQDVRERISKSMLYKLDSKKNFIRGVDIETSFSQFKKNIDLDEDMSVVFKKKGKPVTSGNIGTNTIVEFNTDDMGVTTLVAVVPGDLTGSGRINRSSIKTMCHHIFREKMLEGAYFEAGDINGDGVVDTLDLLLLSRMIEEKS